MTMTSTHRDTGAQLGPWLVNTGRLTGPPTLPRPSTGEDGALPTLELEWRMERSGAREEIFSLMELARLGVSGSGEVPGGLRANTGTEEKWSRGILICNVWINNTGGGEGKNNKNSGSDVMNRKN